MGHVGVEEGLWEVLGSGGGKKQKNKTCIYNSVRHVMICQGVGK